MEKGHAMEELKKQLAQKHIKSLDLSGQELEGIDFSDCLIEQVSFKKCTLTSCRFRRARIKWSDFRYSKFENGTFEDAEIEYCDFYRSMFDGVIIFNACILSNCSINKAYFGDSALIKRENLAEGRILQQDREAYRRFLKEWHVLGSGTRTNDVGADSSWSPDEALKGRWEECENIYKNFSAQWTGRGYISDGNWAYVQGRRMERNCLFTELFKKGTPVLRRIKDIWKLITNVASDLFFGYGESMTKMIVTYIVVVFFFAWCFTSNVSLLEYGQALAISLKNMAGMDSELLHDVSPLVDMLNVVQTTLGIILTGIFGFILGNKIRNQ